MPDLDGAVCDFNGDLIILGKNNPYEDFGWCLWIAISPHKCFILSKTIAPRKAFLIGFIVRLEDSRIELTRLDPASSEQRVCE